MRWYRGPEGDRRLWLDQDEIESLVEDELRKAGLAPSADNPVTDLERFIEGYLRSPLDQYADLEPDVLGVTQFRAGQPPAVLINRDLTGSALDEDDTPPGLRGRWRATLGHEASHVLLHRMLFEGSPNQGSLFPQSPTNGGTMMRCLKRDVGYRTRVSDWREVQANRGMAALLMPRKLFGKVVRSELVTLGISRSTLKAGDADAAQLSSRLAERFDVSRQAASIRLGTLGFTASAETLDLRVGPGA